jgi:hypothetical protein
MQVAQKEYITFGKIKHTFNGYFWLNWENLVEDARLLDVGYMNFIKPHLEENKKIWINNTLSNNTNSDWGYLNFVYTGYFDSYNNILDIYTYCRVSTAYFQSIVDFIVEDSFWNVVFSREFSLSVNSLWNNAGDISFLQIPSMYLKIGKYRIWMRYRIGWNTPASISCFLSY